MRVVLEFTAYPIYGSGATLSMIASKVSRVGLKISERTPFTLTLVGREGSTESSIQAVAPPVSGSSRRLPMTTSGRKCLAAPPRLSGSTVITSASGRSIPIAVASAVR